VCGPGARVRARSFAPIASEPLVSQVQSLTTTFRRDRQIQETEWPVTNNVTEESQRQSTPSSENGETATEREGSTTHEPEER